MASRHLYIFNPDCELAIANGGRFYTPSANVVKMEEDLAFLPAWLGSPGDLVLVKELPDVSFWDDLSEKLLLKCIPVRESELKHYSGLRGEPWGKSPKMCYWLKEKGLGEEWKPEQKEWYSRKKAREGLELLLQNLSFLSEDILPHICSSLSELEQIIGEGCWLVKAPWSSSGKGLLALEGRLACKEEEWLRGMFRRQGYLMLEKKLDKVADFAMEFLADEQNVNFIGWSSFTTGMKGEYTGNYLGPQENIEKKLVAYLGVEKIKAIRREVPRMLREVLPDYRGYLGVDMIVYQEKHGEYTIQPCIEINLRYNMGIVALFLTRYYLYEGSCGEFTIRFYPQAGQAWQEHHRLLQEFPVVYKNNRIKSGYLNLTPVTEATHFIASLIVTEF